MTHLLTILFFSDVGISRSCCKCKTGLKEFGQLAHIVAQLVTSKLVQDFQLIGAEMSSLKSSISENARHKFPKNPRGPKDKTEKSCKLWIVF